MTPDLSKTMDPTGKDIFQLIVEEHRAVDQLGAQYQATTDPHERQACAHNIIKLLSLHAACEEMALYPTMKVRLPTGPQMVAQALAEHLEVKKLLFALDNQLVGQSGYDEKLLACLQDIQEHVQSEEQDLLPALRAVCSDQDVMEMTAAWLHSKKIAPSRPHPDEPNEPPANMHSNAQAAPLDAVRDAGRFSSA